MTKEEKQDHVRKVVAAAGGLSVVGRHFKIAAASVKGWVDRGEIPEGRILGLSELSGWQFTPHMIDSIMYPNETDALPPELQTAA